MSLFNFFDEIYPEKDGALQISNMRFLLSIPEGKGKLLTRRSTAILISAAVLIITVFTVVARYLGHEQSGRLYEHMKPISESIGGTKDEVLTVLADNGLGLVEVTPGISAIPGGYELSNVTFEILLHFEENEGLLDGYTYATQSRLAPKQAAKVLKETLSDFYKETVTFEGGTETLLREKALTELFSGTDKVIFRDSADVTPDKGSGKAVAEYIEYLQAADYWEGRLREYLIKTAHYYRDIEAIYSPDTQMLELKISYQVQADRE